jgi:hypothetical protein
MSSCLWWGFLVWLAADSRMRTLCLAGRLLKEHGRFAPKILKENSKRGGDLFRFHIFHGASPRGIERGAFKQSSRKTWRGDGVYSPSAVETAAVVRQAHQPPVEGAALTENTVKKVASTGGSCGSTSSPTACRRAATVSPRGYWFWLIPPQTNRICQDYADVVREGFDAGFLV